MKRSLSLFLALGLALSLAACGEPAETAEQTAARELDGQVWGVVTTASDQLQALEGVVADTAERGDTDVLGVMVDVLWGAQNSLDDFDADTQSAMLYVGAARAYTANARVVCENMKAYIDDGETSDYNRFLKYLGKVGELTDNVVERRKTFLSGAGFSEEEITEITGETDNGSTTVQTHGDQPAYFEYVKACFAEAFPDAEVSCIEGGSAPQVSVKTDLSAEAQPDGWAQTLEDFGVGLTAAHSTAKENGQNTAMGQLLAADGTILASGYNGSVQFDLFAKRAADEAETARLAAEKAEEKAAQERRSSSSSSRTVYVTPSGSKYHYSSSCNGGSYSATTLDDALSRGLTACGKCT